MAHELHQHWGARKIKRWLEDRGHRMPAFSTVHNLMARHGLLPGAAPGVPATGRFEHAAPNRLWQMDFKGHFPFGDGRCHPLTLLDDHSRFSLCLVHCADEWRETVQEQLVSVFERYGLPDRIWVGWARDSCRAFSKPMRLRRLPMRRPMPQISSTG